MDSACFSFRGLMAPVFTPFNQDKTINFEVIPEYAKYLHTHGVQGILVNGTTGEGVSLTTKERKEVLHAWIKASQPYNQTIMVQIGGTNMEDVKNLAKHAEELKVSSILCLADLFFRPNSVDDLIYYLKIVCNSAPHTPLLYYHIPSFTGINVNMKELLEKSWEISSFAGIKFTDNDLVMGSSCISNNFKQYSVFIGNDRLFFPALLQGFNSAIGTTINMFPLQNNRIFRFFKEGNFASAAEEQKILNHNIDQITKLGFTHFTEDPNSRHIGKTSARGPWVTSMKAAMRLLTPIDVGPVRDPLLEMDTNNINLCLL